MSSSYGEVREKTLNRVKILQDAVAKRDLIEKNKCKIIPYIYDTLSENDTLSDEDLKNYPFETPSIWGGYVYKDNKQTSTFRIYFKYFYKSNYILASFKDNEVKIKVTDENGNKSGYLFTEYHISVPITYLKTKMTLHEILHQEIIKPITILWNRLNYNSSNYKKLDNTIFSQTTIKYTPDMGVIKM